LDDSGYSEVNAGHTGAETDSYTAERYVQFAELLPPAATDILDVGCSTGRGGEVLAARMPQARVVGLDVVDARLDRLPACYAGGMLASSTDIPVDDATYDAVVAGEFIEHLKPQDVMATLVEFFRVIKPGGVLLLTTPNPEYWRLRLTGQHVLGGAHLSEHRPKDLRDAVAKAGFENIRTHASGRMTRAVGKRLPLSVYGSYLLEAHRGPRQTGAGSPQ
jgi:2-polyprenyl-3-methyl-5-hydroxy-6-metoxy-1,4-benzoquinol methylase